jgi:hypothetical protein
VQRMPTVRARFWLEVVLGSVFLLALIVTLISREWIELLLGVSPDGGSGALEWGIVAVLGAATLIVGAFAHREWRRPRPVSAPATPPTG